MMQGVLANDFLRYRIAAKQGWAFGPTVLENGCQRGERKLFG
jgi:hypothetical protein